MRRFSYQKKQFSAARSSLMLPHPEGEAASIASAFYECSRGLHTLDEQELDDSVRYSLTKVKELMDTSGLANPADPDQRGLWMVKADSLTEEQKFDLSRAVDELAHWFEMEFWSHG